MTEAVAPKPCYVTCPIDMFRRPSVVRMMRRWPRSIEWWFAVAVMAREANSGGRLIRDHMPLTREDVSLLHGSEIDSEWFDYVVSIDWLRDDEEGLALERPQDWYRPPSREPETEAARGRRRREVAKSSAERPQSSAERPQSSAERPQSSAERPQSSAERPQSSAHNLSQSKLSQVNLNKDKSSQSNPSESGRPTDADGPDGPGQTEVLYESDVNDVTEGIPPTPIGDPRTLPRLRLAGDPVWVILAARRVFGCLEPRSRWTDERAKAVVDWRNSWPDYTPAVLAEAVAYAAPAVQWAREFGPSPIKSTLGYLLHVAGKALFEVADRRVDRIASYEEGFDDPGELRWTPDDNAEDSS